MTAPDCLFCAKLAAPTALPPDELIAQLPHSIVLLGPWQYYHGYCVVVARHHARELNDLGEAERHGYFADMCRVAWAIQECFHPWKLNYELLGNQVPHLHWHLFPRYEHDPGRLQPVWLALAGAERDRDKKRRLSTGPAPATATAAALRQALAGS